MRPLKHIKSFDHENLHGGRADNQDLKDILKLHPNYTLKQLERQLEMGIKIESEHTKDRKIQREIALDHLSESPTYYTDLKNMEKKEDKKKYK